MSVAANVLFAVVHGVASHVAVRRWNGRLAWIAALMGALVYVIRVMSRELFGRGDDLVSMTLAGSIALLVVVRGDIAGF